MKASQLTIGTCYKLNASWNKHVLQYIAKQEHPKKWIFKRIKTIDKKSGATVNYPGMENEIWGLKAHELKNLSVDTPS